jgi:Peptidase S46
MGTTLMKRKIASIRTLLLLSIAIAAPGVATADEGMWPFNNPPREALKTKHNFDATDAWLDHLMHSAVRFNSGGSASFVSADGLVMTNHHVGSGALQKLSTHEHDFIATGFYAKTREQEVKCPDLELNVLINMEDVTQRVNAAVKPGMSAADAQVARRAIMNTIEQESLKATGLRSDVVTLYQGGQYQLYRYKKYTDVRLVFAPEKDIAFFGGDPDNFEYPRYDMDICFFRAYENDRPAKIEHYLKWSKSGAKDGELVFVAGNPGHTDRLNTLTHLEFLRDHSMPDSLNGIRRSEVLLRTYKPNCSAWRTAARRCSGGWRRCKTRR